MSKKIEVKRDELIYGIVTGGKVVAVFTDAHDRDECMDCLAETYDDVLFEGVNLNDFTAGG